MPFFFSPVEVLLLTAIVLLLMYGNGPRRRGP